MAVSCAKFQIAISGPEGSVFPSFPCDELAEGDVAKITLSNIRHRCNISTRLLFTADGESHLDDTTTLKHYMTLSAEGHKILEASGDIIDVTSIPVSITASAANQAPASALPTTPSAGTKTPTFQVRVIAVTPSGSLALPAENTALKALLEQANKVKFLDRGTLPTFSDTSLQASTASFAGTVSSNKYKEPAELDAAEWDVVFRNNRALHGYYRDSEKGILVKASKPAFRLRGAPTPGIPATDTSATGTPGAGTPGSKTTATYNPPIPPFYIDDAATINVTEIRDQAHTSLIKEGFNSLMVGGSIGAEVKNIPGSVSSSFDTEHAWAKENTKAKDTHSLVVTYNFPRVVVELDPECLELTPECALAAKSMTTVSEVASFKRRFGHVFATCFTLGGSLHSTRSISKNEKASLDQIKDQVRIAAGLSIQTPFASGSFDIASTNGTGSQNADAAQHQQARLVWDARGGDTLLASNPAAWVSTVKDPRLWRLMNQQRMVDLIELIGNLDSVAYQNIIRPSSFSTTGKDPITDPDYNKRIRISIMEQLAKATGESETVRRMEQYYQNGGYDARGMKLETYNKFRTETYPEAHAGEIKEGCKWRGLKLDQKVYFGLFMASMGESPL